MNALEVQLWSSQTSWVQRLLPINLIGLEARRRIHRSLKLRLTDSRQVLPKQAPQEPKSLDQRVRNGRGGEVRKERSVAPLTLGGGGVITSIIAALSKYLPYQKS